MLLKPPIVSRTEWGCPDGEENSRAAPEYTSVTHLVIHHTVLVPDSESVEAYAALVRSIWDLHVFTRGWNDIGYNFLIDPAGLVYEGRAGSAGETGEPGERDVRGAHFICANEGTMGVALLGDFTHAPPSPEALDSLARLLAWKCRERAIDPLGASLHPATMLHLEHICGHRDGNGAPPESGACPIGTECPGEMLYRLLPGIRQRVRVLLDDCETVADE